MANSDNGGQSNANVTGPTGIRGWLILPIINLFSTIIVAGASVVPMRASATDFGCGLKLPGYAGSVATGIVTSIIDPKDLSALQLANEGRLGAMIDPAYKTQHRISYRRDSDGQTVIAVLPDNIVAKVGDKIEVTLVRSSPSFPCGYIPTLVNKVVR